MEKLIVSISPHIKSKDTINSIMRDVIISLIPGIIAATYFFGWYSLIIIVLCVVSCVLTEIITQKLFGKPITINDLSAVVTGILLAFCLPPQVPFWIPIIGGIIAIFLVKQVFGGLGYNFMNPALGARAFLLASWPICMTLWQTPIDAITSASPLGIIKQGLSQALPSYGDLFIGYCGGCLGETSKLAIILGAIYLFIRKIINWRIPFFYISTVFIFSSLIGKDPLFNILSGGLFLGAFFMATDMVTSPITGLGKIIFGISCGILTSLFRFYGGFPEGVCYSIIFMNCWVPLINKGTRSKKFGWRKK
ncbi:MAG: RnfABCDGE type electron transport complex subunit D [bacterium]